MLPRLPPFAFGEREILPASWDTAAAGEIPLQLYRHQRLRRAVGELPSHIILPPALSVPKQSLVEQGGREGQFRGGLAVASWNAQAFFTTCDVRFPDKIAYLHSLMGQHDAVLIQEAHGTAGTYRSWRAPNGCNSWWSAGAS